MRSIGTVQERSALAATMEVAQLRGEAAQNLTLVRERKVHLATSAQVVQVSEQSIATVRDEPPRQLPPMALAPLVEVSMQGLAVADEVQARAHPATACEQIWDQMRDEWAEACRRVDELRLVVRNSAASGSLCPSQPIPDTPSSTLTPMKCSACGWRKFHSGA